MDLKPWLAHDDAKRRFVRARPGANKVSRHIDFRSELPPRALGGNRPGVP